MKKRQQQSRLQPTADWRYSDFFNWCSLLALKDDGSVVTWGLPIGVVTAAVFNLNCNLVSQDLSTSAALKDDGSVVTWGNEYGDGNSVSTKLGSGVVDIIGCDGAFAALKDDGPLLLGGLAAEGTAMSVELESGVSQIFSTGHAFAALKENGSVVTWVVKFCW